ncbi:hypothetical protein [Robertmurraya siralis]|uniref:hypothetical protein n=1 Tax=Robertmurraya siralis TaxID=77777 RepID=UPI0010F4C4BB|nr:hypothetical protein [Robertmurraya siralis]
MAVKKNTDIKFSEVKKKAKETHVKEKFELEDGSTITFYPVFPQTEIEKMLIEIQKTLQSKGQDFEIQQDILMKFIVFHCIKYFTHFKSQLTADTYEGKLVEMNAFIDHEIEGKSLFNIIADEVFLQKEIHKVFDFLAKQTGNLLFLNSLEKTAKEQFEKLELQNRDVIEKLSKKRKQIPEV